LRDARHGYLRWGAAGKVRQLDQCFPHLEKEALVSDRTGTIGTPVEQLDLATVIKVSQAVSGEIVLDALIDTLMRTALEHAGAARGLLILTRGAEQRIQAEATTSGDTVVVDLRAAPVADALPESIVHYVARTHETVILDDASARNPFAGDPYVRRQQTRSVLCLPLVNRGTLIGVLYLENNLAPRVFTPTRIAVLKLLASQAAISLENTRLYGDLEQREAKIRRLVDANIIGMCIWNVEGTILEANDAFLHIVGYRGDDVVSGRVRWTDLTPVQWRDADTRAAAELKASGTFQPFEKELFRQDGSRVPVLIGGATFEGSSEGVSFVLDLSEQKRTAEALRRSQADLAHMARVTTMGELTASVAHEIKQPITAARTDARTCLRWLRRDDPDVAEACEAAARAVKGAERAADIITSISALFTKGALPRQLVDVNELIREMVAMLRSEANRYGIAVDLELAPDLPAIIANPVQLQQVLMNLILNAIDAMQETGCGNALTIRSEAGHDQVVIAVSDTGVGLPAQADQIFNAFFTTKVHGTGMGLSISRSIIESHGGRLWATGNAGRGAIFQFSVPTIAADV
jgi:PAS domain S-box-containing protein